MYNSSFDTSQVASLKERMSLMRGWSAKVIIRAPRQLVWEQVTDFESHAEWNPFVKEAHATEFVVGEQIRFLEEMKQFGQHWIKATFLSIDPYEAFVWQGYLGAPFLFSVRHSFVFESIDKTHTRFTQVHENSGLLIPFLALRGIYCVSYQGYQSYNQALKKRCERLYKAG